MRLDHPHFSGEKIGADAAIVAALATATQQVFPGTKITKIEEKK